MTTTPTVNQCRCGAGRGGRDEMAKVELVKVARIRHPGYPVGHWAPMYLNCPCGARPEASDNMTYCPCGRIYDANGYLVRRPLPDYRLPA